MKKIVFVSAVALVAALSASSNVALAANLNQNATDFVRDSMEPWNRPEAAAPGVKGKRSKRVAVAASSDPNEQGRRLFRDHLVIYWPTAVKAIVYPIGNNSK